MRHCSETVEFTHHLCSQMGERVRLQRRGRDSVSPGVKTSRKSDSSQRANGRRVHEWLPGNRIRQFSALVSSQKETCFAFTVHTETVTCHLPSECA